MEEVSIIGIDLAKRSFQVHGARPDGSVAYRRKLSRGKLLSFIASQPGCTVAMEACGSAHYWGREIAALGHEVRLVPPIYVKPFVKRNKNDAADAEAITEAAQRPTMHFVAVKTEAQQAQAMLFHTRDLLVRQRTRRVRRRAHAPRRPALAGPSRWRRESRPRRCPRRPARPRSGPACRGRSRPGHQGCSRTACPRVPARCR